MNAKKTLISLGLCLAIVGVGAGVVFVAFMIRTAEPGAGAIAATEKSEKVAAVKVQVLKPRTLEDRLVVTGGIEPWEQITVSAEIPGKIEFQGAEEGHAVTAGQELFRIDTQTIAAKLDQARAQLRLANQDFERTQQLSRQGIDSTQALDTARAAKDVAAANLRTLDIQLSKSVVTAPLDGVIDKVFRKRNEYIDTGAPLFRLVQVHKVKAVAGIPERDISWFKLGDRVTVQVDALGDRVFPGSIYRLAPTAEVATRTFTTEIESENADGALKPGMIARTTFVRRTFPDAILAPIFAVLAVEDQRFAVVEQGGTVHMRPIELGILQGSEVQVTRGLSQGDRLVVAGQRDLKDGEAVQVQEVLE